MDNGVRTLWLSGTGVEAEISVTRSNLFIWKVAAESGLPIPKGCVTRKIIDVAVVGAVPAISILIGTIVSTILLNGVGL